MDNHDLVKRLHSWPVTRAQNDLWDAAEHIEELYALLSMAISELDRLGFDFDSSVGRKLIVPQTPEEKVIFDYEAKLLDLEMKNQRLEARIAELKAQVMEDDGLVARCEDVIKRYQARVAELDAKLSGNEGGAE